MSFQQDIRGMAQVLETPPLPPGFRFHPTDEELVSFYLTQKVLNSNFVFQAIGEVDFNKCEPWDLRERAKMSESMFYFFSLRDRKYPTGMRTNRATEAGYWKATGKDRDVLSSTTGRLVGMKKTLVFYTGRAPKGEKTNWIMHEYRFEDDSTPHQQEWVVCRVFEKSGPSKKVMPAISNENTSSYNGTFGGNQSLPALQNLEPNSPNSVRPSNYMFTGLHLSESNPSQGYFQGATIPGHEMVLRRTISSISGRRDSLPLGESLETLLSGWESNMYPLEWTGDGGDGGDGGAGDGGPRAGS